MCNTQHVTPSFEGEVPVAQIGQVGLILSLSVGVSFDRFQLPPPRGPRQRRYISIIALILRWRNEELYTGFCLDRNRVNADVCSAIIDERRRSCRPGALSVFYRALLLTHTHSALCSHISTVEAESKVIGHSYPHL